MDSNAVKHEYPWIVMIQKTCDVDSTPEVCTGTLISPSIVISTKGCAQCHCCLKNETRVSYFYEAFAILGAYEWKGIYQNLPYEKDFQVIKITDFKEPTSGFHNDLALLVMEFPAKLSKTVCPVLLPDPTMDSLSNVDGEAAGWTSALHRSKDGQIEVIAKLKKCDMKVQYMTADPIEHTFHQNKKYKWLKPTYLFKTILAQHPSVKTTCEPCEQDKG